MNFSKFIHNTNRLEKHRLILFAPFIIWLGIFLGLEILDTYNIIGLCFIIIVVSSIFFALKYFKIFNAFINNILKTIILFFFGLFLANITINNHKHNININSGPNDISGKIVNIQKVKSGNWQLKIDLESLNQSKVKSKYVVIYSRSIFKDSLYKSINCKAILNKPSLPIYPKAYNYAKIAYFQDIIASGTCLNEAQFQNNSLNFWQSILFKYSEARYKISSDFADGKTGGGGGLLAALTTGDRSYINLEDWRALQVSGLGHIVSVSGLHISLIGGIIYLIFNKIFVLFPNIALRYDVRKLSAIVSMILLINYTIFTGFEAPAVRSLIMAMVAFIAIILNRKAISNRGLCFAALIQLIIKPESAIDVSFQMSFMATLALVAMWETYNNHRDKFPKNIMFKVFEWISAAVLISFVAGAATMPITIYNFGQVSSYSILANLIATPINDFIIGPFSVLGALFSIIGLGDIFWSIAKFGAGLIIRIGYIFESIKYSNLNINYFDDLTYIIIISALVFLCIFKSKLRYVSIFLACFAFINFSFAPKPILITARVSNAMLSLNPKKGEEIKYCFIDKGNWDAKSLIRSAKLNYVETEILLKNIGYLKAKACSISSGDFKARFIKILDNKHEPIIAIEYNGKTYALDKNTAPNGAILYRKNWKLNLYKPQNKKTYYN